jgi:Kef-type K+ transport system membrane component KefB
VISGLITGLALTTTALGTMLPMWRDSGLLRTRFGSHALAIGTLGEFGPIIAIAILLSGHGPGRESVLLAIFIAIAIGIAALALRPRAPRAVRLLREHLYTSAQLPVRVAVLLIIALLWVANSFGLDVLLGAFTAGIVVRLGNTGESEPVVRTKLEAIGFGFLIPIFFVVSGMEFDLDALTDDPSSLLRLPVFLGLFLLVRGLPVLLYRGELPPGARWPMALFSGTALPLVVVITQIGTDTGRMAPENAAALVGAAMLSVVIYPSIAFALLRRRGEPAPDPAIGEPAGDATMPAPIAEPEPEE